MIKSWGEDYQRWEASNKSSGGEEASAWANAVLAGLLFQRINGENDNEKSLKIAPVELKSYALSI